MHENYYQNMIGVEFKLNLYLIQSYSKDIEKFVCLSDSL
jgi:hypothetical protein